MATKKTDVIKLTEKDFKGKSFKVAPSGKYIVKFNAKTAIKAGRNGNLLNVMITITKGEHKGVNIFDNIAPHVGWKIAQLLKAMGIKKVPKKLTLQELLKMVKKYAKDLRAIVKVEMYQGKKQNKVVQYLPLASDDDEGDDDDIDEAEDEDSDEDGDEDGDDDDSDDDEDDDSEDDDDEDSDDDEDDDDDESDDDEDDDEDEDEDEDSDDEDEDEEDEDDDADDEDEDDDSDDEDDEDEDDEDEDDEPVKKKGKAKPKAKPKKAVKKPAAKKKGKR